MFLYLVHNPREFFDSGILDFIYVLSALFLPSTVSENYFCNLLIFYLHFECSKNLSSSTKKLTEKECFNTKYAISSEKVHVMATFNISLKSIKKISINSICFF